MNSSVKDVFPKSAEYSLQLIKEKSVGGNVLFSLESLLEFINLKPCMRVLDLGCGKCLSSVFLAKEFNVNVWAVDNYFSASDNFKFIDSQGLADRVFPLSSNADKLPFAEDFFDCIFIINSYTYFGTDDKYLPYISQFLKVNGQIGVSDITIRKEITSVHDIPPLLLKDYFDYWYYMHSPDWWKNKWEKSGYTCEINCLEVSKEQHQLMKASYIDFCSGQPEEAFAKALANDKDNLITFFNLIGKRSCKKSFLQNSFENY